jgi:hypothetical protein
MPGHLHVKRVLAVIALCGTFVVVAWALIGSHMPKRQPTRGAALEARIITLIHQSAPRSVVVGSVRCGEPIAGLVPCQAAFELAGREGTASYDVLVKGGGRRIVLGPIAALSFGHQ